MSFCITYSDYLANIGLYDLLSEPAESCAECGAQFVTPDGFNVELNPIPQQGEEVGMSLIFSNVLSEGTTTVSRVLGDSVNFLGVSLASLGRFYISTTANFTGEVLVRVTMPASISPEEFSVVRVIHFSSSGAENATIMDGTYAPNYAARTLYGRVYGFSMLAVAADPGEGCPEPVRPLNCPDACVQTTEGFDGCLIMYCSDQGPECYRSSSSSSCSNGTSWSECRSECVQKNCGAFEEWTETFLSGDWSVCGCSCKTSFEDFLQASKSCRDSGYDRFESLKEDGFYDYFCGCMCNYNKEYRTVRINGVDVTKCYSIIPTGACCEGNTCTDDVLRDNCFGVFYKDMTCEQVSAGEGCPCEDPVTFGNSMYRCPGTNACVECKPSESILAGGETQFFDPTDCLCKSCQEALANLPPCDSGSRNPKNCLCCEPGKTYRECSEKCEYDCSTSFAEVGESVWDDQLCKCKCEVLPDGLNFCFEGFKNTNMVVSDSCKCVCPAAEVEASCTAAGVGFGGNVLGTDSYCICICDSNPMVLGRLDKCPQKATDMSLCACDCDRLNPATGQPHFPLYEGHVYSLTCESICPQQRGAGPFQWYSEAVGEYQDLHPSDLPPCPDSPDGRKGLFDTSICECTYPCAAGYTIEICDYNGEERINCVQPCPDGQVLLPCNQGQRICGCADAPNGNKRQLQSEGFDPVTGDLIQRCVCSFRSSPPSFPQNTEFPNCSWLEYEDNDTCECICSEESVNRPKCESASREYDNSNCECKECDEGFTYSQSRKMCVTAQFYCMTCEQLTPQELETLLQSDPEAKGFDTEADCVCPVNVCESYRYGTFHNGSYTFDCSTQGYAQCPPDFYRCHSCNPAPGSPTSSQCQYVYDGRYIVTQCCDAQGPIPGRPSFCNSLGFADACNDPPSYWTVDPSGAGFEGLMVYNTYTVVENCSNPGLFQTGTCG